MAAANPISPSAPMIPPLLVIVPARNEKARIEECVQALLAQRPAIPTRIIIAVNGSSDGTAEAARRAVARTPRSEGVQCVVIEIEEASKPLALNRSESMAGPAAVIAYLDADVRISSGAFDAVYAAAIGGSPRIVQPRRVIASDARGASRIFGRAHLRLPWVAKDISTGGFFAVNAAGRARWGEFPRVAADDAFVFSHFTPDERRVLDGCTATHPYPDRIRGLLRQQRRWRDARVALQRARPTLRESSAWPLTRRMRAIVESPSLLIDLAVVRLVRVLAMFARTSLAGDSWNPDRVMPGVRR